MKLYSFVFNDNTNLKESELVKSAMEFIEEEANLQMWAPGFTLHQSQAPQFLPNGEQEYYFEVHGEYLPYSEDSEAQNQQRRSNSNDDMAAAP